MHILLTGGGTGGHVLPNLAIADAILEVSKKKAKLSYIGSHHGPERDMIKHTKIPFESVSTGKLRRYFDLRNFVDLFRILLGIIQAFVKLGRIKPDIIFSKGGFVGFPVIFAGWLRRIPIIIHESDAIPGLTTKLSAPFAKKILLAYKIAKFKLKKYKFKIIIVGNPIRKEILKGSVIKAKKLTGFSGEKPVLLVMGGSSGAQQINQMVKNEKERLIDIFDVIHITGKGKGREKKEKNYLTMHYANKEMKDLYALASLALTRAGANTLAELEALQMPALLYPLSMKQSRGDQYANAKEMCSRHSFFKLAHANKLDHSELLLLPKRSKETQGSDVAKKIALIILDQIS